MEPTQHLHSHPQLFATFGESAAAVSNPEAAAVVAKKTLLESNIPDYIVKLSDKFGSEAQQTAWKQSVISITAKVVKIYEQAISTNKLEGVLTKVLDFLANSRQQIARQFQTAGYIHFGVRRDAKDQAEIIKTKLDGCYLKYSEIASKMHADLMQMTPLKCPVLSLPVHEKILDGYKQPQHPNFEKKCTVAGLKIGGSTTYSVFPGNHLKNLTLSSIDSAPVFVKALVDTGKVFKKKIDLKTISMSQIVAFLDERPLLAHFKKNYPDLYQCLKICEIEDPILEHFDALFQSVILIARFLKIPCKEEKSVIFVNELLKNPKILQHLQKASPQLYELLENFGSNLQIQEDRLELLCMTPRVQFEKIDLALSSVWTWRKIDSKKNSIALSKATILHQDSFLIEKTLAIADRFFKAALSWDRQDIKVLRENVATLEYLVSHATPYLRGSSAVTEWLVLSLYLLHGFRLTYSKDDCLNLVALTTNLSEFLERYDSLISLEAIT